MLVLVLACVGVTLVVTEILVSEFNDGNHSNFASWVAGAYVTVGTVCLIGGQRLICVLCYLPTITILTVKLIRRMSHAERVQH